MPKDYYGSNDMAEAKKRARKVMAEKKGLKTKDKYDKPSVGDKFILALLRAKRKITGKGKKKAGSKAKTGTVLGNREANIAGLERAGVNKEAIARMRGKKK